MALSALSIGKSESYHTPAQRSIIYHTMLNPHRHGPHPDKAPRFDRHYTRRNRTSPLWAGLEQASVGRFKKRRKAIKLAPGAENDFTTISIHRLPPLPPLHEPASQNVRLRQASFSGLTRDLYPRTAPTNNEPLPMFLHVLSTCLTNFRQAALPLLHVDDYHSLRLTCRFTANLLPGFQPDRLMNLGPYSSNLSRQCRNMGARRPPQRPTDARIPTDIPRHARVASSKPVLLSVLRYRDRSLHSGSRSCPTTMGVAIASNLSSL